MTFCILSKEPQTVKTLDVDHIIKNPKLMELLRRIPKENILEIRSKLELVKPEHLESLELMLSKPSQIFTLSSFIRNEMFPYSALMAVGLEIISPFQFGTLMALWSNLSNITPSDKAKQKQSLPEYVALFNENRKKNPFAYKLLLDCLEPPRSNLIFLVSKEPRELLKAIYKNAPLLPESEQGFWILRENTQDRQIGQTITDIIKSQLGIRYLKYLSDEQSEMLPSMGLQQLFLDAAFPHPVRINPVLGESTPLDIRKGSIERYRDIALPFPGNELPKLADNYPAPLALDFMFHDFYHAIRASRVHPTETIHYINIADRIHLLQQLYDTALKQLLKVHAEHIRLLPTFGTSIKKLSNDMQHKVIKLALEKFNREILIINMLKKMRKSNGQLKFRIWDMERPLSGGELDGPYEFFFPEFVRVLGNIAIEISLLGKLPNTIALNGYSGRKLGQIMLDVLKPTQDLLRETQEQIRHGREIRSYFGPEEDSAQVEFENAILSYPSAKNAPL